MDVSASWQFLVDAIEALVPGQWRFVAPDLRGFGLSQPAGDGIYSYTDYLADLDALHRAIAPAEPLRLVGHSLGGNIASLYAGVRPECVRALVNLEGFGLRQREADEAPVHLRQWLDDLDRFVERRPFADREAIVARVRAVSARVSAERAGFIADHWGLPMGDGRWCLRADPAHLGSGPDLWRLDEALAVWGAVEAPALWVEAAQSENIARHHLTPAGLARRRAAFRQLRVARIPDAGHMMHWEHPETLAGLIEPFLARP
jgi:pimeloyl-ACP methyl ester carboxylesterase